MLSFFCLKTQYFIQGKEITAFGCSFNGFGRNGNVLVDKTVIFLSLLF